MINISIVIGTRPEAIKMAPVVYALRNASDFFNVTLISTGQHRDMLQQVLGAFSLRPDIDLNVMEQSQTLSGLTAKIIKSMDSVLDESKPDMMLVQGDTTTVFAAAMAGYYKAIKVGHVEAGLRSHDMANPFPEEANRRLVSVVSELHFAPTKSAVDNLLAENISSKHIVATGNTVTDALQHVAELPLTQLPSGISQLLEQLSGQRLILVTMHRRENQGDRMTQVCRAIATLVRTNPDLVVAIPVHMSPSVREVVHSTLADIERVHLIPPLDYQSFVHLMKKASLILTDSGGIQEEAPTFSVPVLVLRELTERPEAKKNGLSLVVGTDACVIQDKAGEILSGGELYKRMHQSVNPFGDGRSSQRIVLALVRYFQGCDVLLSPEEQFGMIPENN